ncbi:hypothetical protein VCHA54P499_10246 [Vibrio chagasii]|nr:hypothetical protein VCHA54P499_10246 [Vibrio chagasii]CAH7100443.1 hypothetical protein VCHA53O466_10356 [Vibrio chagasii]
MNFTSMKQELDYCAVHAKSTMLDETIIDGTLLHELHDGKYENTSMDIPLNRLVGINREHRRFFDLGNNWREAVLGVPVDQWDPSKPYIEKGLHCKGWKREKVKAYYESDLYQLTFHVPNSTNWLRCSLLGGVAYVELGAHRAVAGKIWLTYHNSETAVFQNVYCYQRTLRGCVKSWLADCKKVGGFINWYTVSKTKRLVELVLEDKQKVFYYDFVDGTAEEIEMSVFENSKISLAVPQVITSSLINALLDDSWA